MNDEEMRAFIRERVEFCLSMDGPQAAKRHIELLNDGWQLRFADYPFPSGRVAVRLAMPEVDTAIRTQVVRREIDLGVVAIDACAIGYEQLLRPQNEEGPPRLQRGVGLWYPPDNMLANR